ncbi:Myelin basic protein, partial [Galemys pyrenaicus]
SPATAPTARCPRDVPCGSPEQPRTRQWPPRSRPEPRALAQRARFWVTPRGAPGRPGGRPRCLCPQGRGPEESGIVHCGAGHISLLFAGRADAGLNNEGPSPGPAVTDATRAADPKNAWPAASPADPGGRPHLVRLFSRDAPGREDNTFKDRPSESDELQTIQEDSTATPEGPDAMASQKRPSQRHGSKYLASASTMDHARHGFLPRHRDATFLDSLGRFFSGDRGAPKRGSGKVPWLQHSRSALPSHARSQPGLCSLYKDTHHAARTTHYGSLPQKSQHGRAQDENPVVHFFKNIVSALPTARAGRVTPRTPPPSQGKVSSPPPPLARAELPADAWPCGPHTQHCGRPRPCSRRHSGAGPADAQLSAALLSCRAPRGRSQDSATEAERPPPTRDSRPTTPRARFPKSLSW